MNRLIKAFVFVLVSILLSQSLSSWLYYTLFFLILVYIARRQRSALYKNILEYSYLFYALCGALAVLSYQGSYGQTFAPYHDDQYYYDTILALLSGYKETVILSATLYEYIVAGFYSIFSWIAVPSHMDLLPLNWCIGALTILESIKLSDFFFPLSKKKYYVLPVLVILFNSNYINGIVHLYRDGLMCYFLLLSVNHTLRKKYGWAILFAIFTGMVRGANGMLCFLFIALCYFSQKKFFTKVNVFFILVLGAGGVFYLDSTIGLSQYLRNFSYVQDGGSVSLANRISGRMDDFLDQSENKGVIGLMNSGNPVKMAAALPIYMVSPLQAGKLRISEDTQDFGHIQRYKIENGWSLLTIFTGCFTIYALFAGLFYLFRAPDKRLFVIALFFTITLMVITFISMQFRHKMGFIVFFPLLIGCFLSVDKAKISKQLRVVASCGMVLILIYNCLNFF